MSEPAEKCPRCGDARVVHGKFYTSAVRFGFRPEELRWLSLSFQFPEVPLRHEAVMCSACGLLWAEADVAVLRQKLRDHGDDDVKKRLGLDDDLL